MSCSAIRAMMKVHIRMTSRDEGSRETGVMRMARFYDAISDSDTSRITDLLKEGGIEYSIQILGDGVHLKEILVAEEDLAAAEELLCTPAHENT